MLVVPYPAALKVRELQTARVSAGEQFLQGGLGAVEASACHAAIPLVGALFSAEQPECRNDESADSDDAPREIGAERGGLSTEDVRCDILAVLGCLPHGVCDGVGLCGGKLGVGWCAGDGMSVESRIMLPRVVA